MGIEMPHDEACVLCYLTYASKNSDINTQLTQRVCPLFSVASPLCPDIYFIILLTWECAL